MWARRWDVTCSFYGGVSGGSGKPYVLVRLGLASRVLPPSLGFTRQAAERPFPSRVEPVLRPANGAVAAPFPMKDRYQERLSDRK